jgi:hypothetical protein
MVGKSITGLFTAKTEENFVFRLGPNRNTKFSSVLAVKTPVILLPIWTKKGLSPLRTIKILAWKIPFLRKLCCLEELVKIVECRKGGLKVLPIFYHVEPDDVWYQSGIFEVAFAEHEKRFEENTVQKWRAALKEVANLCGMHIKAR